MPDENQTKATKNSQPAEKDMAELSVDFLVKEYSFSQEGAQKFMDWYRATVNDPNWLGPIGVPIENFLKRLMQRSQPRQIQSPQPYLSRYFQPSPIQRGLYQPSRIANNSAEAADALTELKAIETEYRKGLHLDEAMPFGITVQDEYVATVDNKAIVVKDGILTAPVRIAKSMVQDYNGVKVLKCYHELKKAADNARQLPITFKHPKDKIVTSQDQIKGWTTPPVYVESDRALDCRCETSDEKLVKAITDEKKTDVSIGFHCDLVMTPGEYNGVKYDAIQTNIVLNHVAMGIDKGRCPSGECGIGVGTMKTDETDYQVHPVVLPVPGEPGGPGPGLNTKVLTPEEISKLTEKEKAAYYEWLKQHPEIPQSTQEVNNHPGDCTCDVCKKKKAKKDAEPPMPPTPPAEGEPPMKAPEGVEQIPEKLKSAVETFAKTFAETMGKRATLSVEELNKAFVELTTLLNAIKTAVATERGKTTEPKTPQSATSTEIIEKADALIAMAEPSLKELAKVRDSMIAKVDSIMDFKPTKPRSEYEQMNDEALTDARIKFLQSAKSHSTNDSVDPIDKVYADILENRK